MKVEILTPPNETLLSSMLYEGYIRILGSCGEDVDEGCIKDEVLKSFKKEVDFRFAGNDIKYTLKGIQEKFKTNIRGFQDLIDLITKLKIQDLRIDVRLSNEKDAVLVGFPGFTKEEGYSFQIMKVDRYGGISSIESRTFTEQVTTYADLSGLLMFFTGLASSYVTSVGTDYYFLFFDTETLLTWVLKGGVSNIRNWMIIKDNLLEKIKEIIEEYGDINDEAITLSVMCNVSLLEALRKSQVSYTGFRLVKVSMEGQTYKVYVDMPLRIYPKIRLTVNEEEERRMMEEVEKIVTVLIRPASRFIKGKDNVGDGYHAFKALRYLYLYVTTENPSYLGMMYREIHEAYVTSKKAGARHVEGYLMCFMKHTIRF
ncbi:MAG: hypothetical protein QXJ16_02010 [Desulfurococcaceae archaeon]